MNWIDLGCIVILLLFALLGIKNGLAKSLLRFAGNIIAAVLAKIASAPVASYLYETFLKTRIQDKLNETFHLEDISASIDEIIAAIRESIPEGAYEIAENWGLLPKIKNSAGKILSAADIEQDYIRPIITKVLVIITIIALFIILSVILMLVANMIYKRCFEDKKGVLNKANRIFGGVFGLIRGLIPVGVCCLILCVVAPLATGSNLADLVENSFVCNIVSGLL